MRIVETPTELVLRLSAKRLLPEPPQPPPVHVLEPEPQPEPVQKLALA